MVLIINDAMN